MEMDFCAEWTNRLLKGLETNCKPECLLDSCAAFHYEVNQMEEALEPYIGDLDGFIFFLTKTYGWIITRGEDGKTIYADENKNACVCPIAAKMKTDVSPFLCNCSASYAKKMFSKVCRKEVRTKIIRSFLRDQKSCIYEIQI